MKTSLTVFIFICLIFSLSNIVSASESNDLKEQCITILKNGMISESETVRNDAIWYWGEVRIKDPVVEKRISEILSKDKSAYVKVAAINTIGKLQGKAAIPLLTKELVYRGSQAYLVHLSAAVTLYNLGEKNTLESIKSYMNSENIVWSIEASTNAGSLNDGSLIPLLKEKLSTKNRLLKIAVLESLAHLGYNIPNHEIVSLVEQGDILPAINIIKILKKRDFIGTLKKELNSKNPMIQLDVAAALVTLGEIKYKEHIRKHLIKKAILS